MAIASVGTLGTGANSSSNSSYTFNTATNSLASGDFGILVSVTDNTSTTDGDNNEHTSVSGGTGTWTKLGEYTNSNAASAAGVTTSIWLFEATGTVNTGTTITLNFASNRTDKAASFWKFTKGASTTIKLDTEPGTNPITSQVDASAGFGSSAFSGLASKARLYFRGLGKEANSTTQITVSTSFTAINVSRSRNNASAVLARGEFRINTSTGETSNPTLAVTGDTAGLFAALLEITIHALTPTGITATPTVGSPALEQVHVLTAAGVATGAPTVGSPVLSSDDGVNDLVPAGIATGAPTVGTPVFTQIQQLKGSKWGKGRWKFAFFTGNLSTGAPTVGTPVFRQIHDLAATGIATGAPTVGTPVLTIDDGIYDLVPTGISTGAPTVGTPVLGQSHALSATGVGTGAPTVGAPIIGQAHGLVADGIATGAPTVGSPVLTSGGVDNLVPVGISTGAPTVGAPSVAEIPVDIVQHLGGGGSVYDSRVKRRRKQKQDLDELIRRVTEPELPPQPVIVTTREPIPAPKPLEIRPLPVVEPIPLPVAVVADNDDDDLLFILMEAA